MVDLFREVDEALQQEKIAQFWNTNGKYVLALVLSLIIGTALWSGYTQWKISQDHKGTAAFIDITKGMDDETALLSAADLEKKYSWLTSNQKALGHLYLAQKALSMDKHDVAFEHLTSITTMSARLDTNLKNIAAYYARNMILDEKVSHEFSDIKILPNTDWDPLFDIQNSLMTPTSHEDFEENIKELDLLLAKESTASNEIKKIAEQVKSVYIYDMQKSQPSEGEPQS